ncbi:MarR family winged helix-turn-helix transcriptional regulator [Variovorax sp. GB1R11]|uniref:MarR family winged helix-turn-helix transcriptional regulator n=1 Tax=Variovorax sp. GB1R11 TaxID=3443741 RepID=UPI003F490469
MHLPLKLKSDYINLLLDIASERTLDRGSRVYELELGIPSRDVRLLRMIGSSPGITVGQLVQRSAIEKTLVSKLVSSLVQRQLVERHIGIEDARQVQLCLTDLGIDLVMRAEPLGHEMEARFLDCLTEEEMKSLRRILQKIIHAEAASRDIFEFLLTQLRESKASDASASPTSNASSKR